MNIRLSIALLTLAALPSVGLAQGLVTFQNFVLFQTVDPSGGNRLVYVCFIPLSGTQYVAELYAGADANSLVPVTASISRFRSSTTSNKGKWAATGIYGPNDFVNLPANFVEGQTVLLQVKFWTFGDGSGNNGTFETATGAKGQ